MIPSNGISLLNVAVNDIPKYSMENMKLNPQKCKEMLTSCKMIILLQDQLS